MSGHHHGAHPLRRTNTTRAQHSTPSPQPPAPSPAKRRPLPTALHCAPHGVVTRAQHRRAAERYTAPHMQFTAQVCPSSTQVHRPLWPTSHTLRPTSHPNVSMTQQCLPPDVVATGLCHAPAMARCARCHHRLRDMTTLTAQQPNSPNMCSAQRHDTAQTAHETTRGLT